MHFIDGGLYYFLSCPQSCFAIQRSSKVVHKWAGHIVIQCICIFGYFFHASSSSSSSPYSTTFFCGESQRGCLVSKSKNCIYWKLSMYPNIKNHEKISKGLEEGNFTLFMRAPKPMGTRRVKVHWYLGESVRVHPGGPSLGSVPSGPSRGSVRVGPSLPTQGRTQRNPWEETTNQQLLLAIFIFWKPLGYTFFWTFQGGGTLATMDAKTHTYSYRYTYYRAIGIRYLPFYCE